MNIKKKKTIGIGADSEEKNLIRSRLQKRKQDNKIITEVLIVLLRPRPSTAIANAEVRVDIMHSAEGMHHGCPHHPQPFILHN
jgi:hypothetical protein